MGEGAVAPQAAAPAEPPVPSGRFVQVLSGELARFAAATALDFDERCLLEHLLLAADHRSGVVGRFTLTRLASDLGLGPSGRRTLRGRLERLETVGALRLTPAGAGRPGQVQILVYERLVHRGVDDSRRGFVQLVPAALADQVCRHRLSPTAAGLLRRLVIQADPRDHTLPVPSPERLARELQLGRRRLDAALDELRAAAVVAWPAGEPLRVTVYPALVRPAPARAPAPAARSVADRAAGSVKTRGALVLSRAEDQDLEPKTSPPTPPPPPAPTELARGGRELVAKLAARLSGPQAQALCQPLDRPKLALLSSRLEALIDGGWSPAELLDHLGAALPDAWRSPAALLLARARALPPRPPSAEEQRAAAEAERRAREMAAAEAHARSLGGSDHPTADAVQELCRQFGGAALEAAVAVLVRYRPDDDVAGLARAASGGPATGEGHSPTDNETRRRRVKDGSDRAGPTALSELLRTMSGGAQ